MPKIKKETLADETATAVADPVAPEEPSLDVSMQPREVPVKQWPRILKGVCEFCGIVNNDVHGWDQWKYCKHYKKVNIKCLYCPPGFDPEEWFKGRDLTIIERLDKPGKLNVHCDDIQCVVKFHAAWKA